MRSAIVPISVTLLGVLVVLLVWTLSFLEVGNFGQETDIGGGVVLLAGYALTLAGLVSLMAVWLTKRSRHKG